jgi:hypothetical protein
MGRRDGIFLSIRPIFSEYWQKKLPATKKIGRMQKMDPFSACLCERIIKVFFTKHFVFEIF